MGECEKLPSSFERYQDRFARVLAHIEANSESALSIDELSGIAAFSRHHFHRQFSAFLGMSTYKYVQFMRMRRASWRLAFRPEMSVADIALATGYEGPEAFARAFHLAFLGRISPEKRVDRAIAIARAVGMPLKIAAKVDDVDQDYFDGHVKPLLQHPLVDYVGEIGDGEKQAFLGCAIGLLFPIDWEEPFGLVMIEALACGTPVVAYRRGSVPEVLSDGETGFIVEDLAEAIAAARRLPELDRRGCRDAFERNFTASRMANEYVRLYEGLARARHVKDPA